jgi:hypothetical protein
VSSNPNRAPVQSVKSNRGRPATKLALVTAQLQHDKSGTIGQPYQAPVWGWRLLMAFLTSDKRPTIQDACKRAGISRDTYYRYLNDPEFVRWFEQAKKEALSATLSEIQLEHFLFCKHAKDERVRLDAIREYEDRFIPRDAQIVESLPANTTRSVSPYPPMEQRPQNVRELMARVIELQIDKAKTYGDPIPEPWRELSTALDEEQSERERTIGDGF